MAKSRLSVRYSEDDLRSNRQIKPSSQRKVPLAGRGIRGGENNEMETMRITGTPSLIPRTPVLTKRECGRLPSISGSPLSSVTISNNSSNSALQPRTRTQASAFGRRTLSNTLESSNVSIDAEEKPILVSSGSSSNNRRPSLNKIALMKTSAETKNQSRRNTAESNADRKMDRRRLSSLSLLSSKNSFTTQRISEDDDNMAAITEHLKQISVNSDKVNTVKKYDKQSPNSQQQAHTRKIVYSRGPYKRYSNQRYFLWDSDDEQINYEERPDTSVTVINSSLSQYLHEDRNKCELCRLGDAYEETLGNDRNARLQSTVDDQCKAIQDYLKSVSG